MLLHISNTQYYCNSLASSPVRPQLPIIKNKKKLHANFPASIRLQLQIAQSRGGLQTSDSDIDARSATQYNVHNYPLMRQTKH